MAEQAFFAGFEPPPKVPATDAFFFAIHPDTAAIAQIQRLGQTLRRTHGLTKPLLKPENLHITLYDLGEHVGVPASLIDEAMTIAGTIAADPLEITLDRAMNFTNSVVLCGGEGVQPVAALQRRLVEKLQPLNRKPSRHGTPHLTLLYDPKKFDEQPIEPIRWTAREFALIRSFLGQGRHEVLGRWMLAT